jgi:NAD(P)-dependent dehydrogenase (short-subunit alcohol dehydrogenase family)
MTGRVEGKVALVTGAGAVGPGWGNGKAAAVLYAREGARVFAVDLNEAAAEETATIIRGEGGEVAVARADISKADQVEAMVGACVDAFGRIDILHNNVGIVEVGGPVELSNISSVSGIRYTGVPYISYATTKGAILPFTQSVALEYAGRGIRANAILPGLMNTPMIVEPLKDVYGGGDVDEMGRVRDAQCPLGHMGDAWDVAHAALFLASDEAKYITGTTLVVDGGLTAKYV